MRLVGCPEPVLRASAGGYDGVAKRSVQFSEATGDQVERVEKQLYIPPIVDEVVLRECK